MRESIAKWLASRPGLRGVTVDEVVVPESNGMSSETVLVTASWAEDGEPGESAAPTQQRLVFRMAPDMDTMPVFENYDLGVQFRVMADVGRLTDVPVPDAMWLEEDPTHVGSEFFVMDRRDGEVPADVLPYNLGDSFLFDAPAADQHRLQNASVSLLAALHSIPNSVAEFDYLAEHVGLAVDLPPMGGDTTAKDGQEDQQAAGPAGRSGQPGSTSLTGAQCLTNHIERLRQHYEYVKTGIRPAPLIDRAFEWIDANMPAPDTISDPVLLWGDSRIGNVIYRDFEPVGVLDWEMATIGPREMDISWMIFMHQFFEDVARQLDMPGMPAFMRRDDVVELYEDLTGYRPTNMDFYRVLSALHHGIIMIQVAKRSILFGGGAAFGSEGLPDDIDQLIMHRELLKDYMS